MVPGLQVPLQQSGIYAAPITPRLPISRFQTPCRPSCSHTPVSVLLQETIVNRSEPPSSGSTLVLIGQNNRGQWVAQEQRGLFGGLFKNRLDALRYALFENGHRPEAIVEMAGLVELDMSAPSFASAQPIVLPQRHAA
jgi:hypothetical protein